MSGRLAGKVAVITGAGGGIGRETALRFAAEGAAVVGCDLDPDSSGETERQVLDAGGRMMSLGPLDVTLEDDVRRLMRTAEEAFGGVDVLYNNAYALRPGSALDVTREDLEFTLRSTVVQYWLCAKHATEAMRPRGGGSIINISSIAGEDIGTGIADNRPFAFSYALGKAATNRLTELLAVELAPLHIRVNTIAPGVIEHAGIAEVLGPEGSRMRRSYLDSFLIKRLGRPQDVAGAAVFFASDESAFATGAHLRIDGGWKVSGQRGWPITDDH